MISLSLDSSRAEFCAQISSLGVKQASWFNKFNSPSYIRFFCDQLRFLG